jgi:hypothetical protein
MATITPDPRPAASPQPEPSVSSVLAGAPTILVKDLERTPRERRRLYIALHLKLLFVVGIGLAWAGFSSGSRFRGSTPLVSRSPCPSRSP